MAKIILDPGEIFEHYHAQESVTTLLEGEVIYRCGQKAVRLKIGEPFVVPAKTPHILENCGLSEARVGCGGHGSR